MGRSRTPPRRSRSPGRRRSRTPDKRDKFRSYEESSSEYETDTDPETEGDKEEEEEKEAVEEEKEETKEEVVEKVDESEVNQSVDDVLKLEPTAEMDEFHKMLNEFDSRRMSMEESDIPSPIKW